MWELRGAVPMGLTQTVPQLTRTSSPRRLWAPGTPQGQQCPKGFDNWFLWASALHVLAENTLAQQPHAVGQQRMLFWGLKPCSYQAVRAVKAHSSHWGCEGLSAKLCLVSHMTAEMRGAVLVLEVTGLPRVRSKKI